MTVAGDRAYVPHFVTAPAFADRVAIYDLSAEPPALVRIADGGGFEAAFSGPPAEPRRRSTSAGATGAG